jgi:trimeric autotransporter adhesin
MRALRVCVLLAVAAAEIACGRRPASIDVTPKKVRIYGIEGSQRLTAGVLDRKGRPVEQASVTWSSAKDSVASVDASGRVTAKSEGKTTIQAKYEKLAAQIPVEVVDIKTIDVQPSSLRLIGPPGIQYPVTILAKNSKGKPAQATVVWSSTKPQIATVDAKGMVTAVAPGTTTLVAKLGDLQAACDAVIVFHDISRLQLQPSTAIVHAGELQKFDVIGFGADGKSIEGLSTVFSSSDPAVARIDQQGLATGVVPGTATIRASLGSLTAEATMLVN